MGDGYTCLSSSWCQVFDNFNCDSVGQTCCEIPLAVQQAIAAAGDNCADTGSGVADNGCYADNASGEAKSAGASSDVGSGVAITGKADNVSKAIDASVAPENNVEVDLGSSVQDATISDNGGSGDTFVVYNGTSVDPTTGDTISIGAAGGNFNTLYAGNAGGTSVGGDKLIVASGDNNFLYDGSGGDDLLSVGATEAVGTTSNGNLLELADVTGDPGSTLTVGTGSNNSLIAGNGTGDVLHVGDAPTNNITALSNYNLLSVGNGNGDLLSIDQGSDNVLIAGNGNDDDLSVGANSVTTTTTEGTTVTFASSNGNYLKAGNGNDDVLSVLNGNKNTLLAGSGMGDVLGVGTGNDNFLETHDTTASTSGGDFLSIGTGNYNTVLSGDGANDSLSLDSGNYNVMAAGNGAGDMVFAETGNYNTLIAGDGTGDTLGFETGNNNSIYSGDGADDQVAFLSGNMNYVSMGNGNGDSAAFLSGSCNDIVTGDGNSDEESVVGGSGFTAAPGTSEQSTFLVGNGDDDIIQVGSGDNNLLQCGNGNDDLLGIGWFSQIQTLGLFGVETLNVWNFGVGNNNVLEAGNGNGDILMGGLGDDTLVAGGGLGDAVFSSTSGWNSGGQTFGDILTGNGAFDLSGAISDAPAAINNYDTYVLNCQGGDLVQDTTSDLQNALIVNFGGASTSEVFVPASGSSSTGSNSCGGLNDCGYNFGCGESGTTETVNSFNAIDVTDFAFTGSFSATYDGTGVDGSELWTFSNGSGGQSLTLDLFGNFTAAGFQFTNDTGLINEAQSLYNGTTIVQGEQDSAGTVITYTAPTSTTSCSEPPCVGSSCTITNQCGPSSSSCSTGCGETCGSSAPGCGESSCNNSSTGCVESSQFLTSCSPCG
jgi:hypothetical protein